MRKDGKVSISWYHIISYKVQLERYLHNALPVIDSVIVGS